jgi:hypothetical protein
VQTTSRVRQGGAQDRKKQGRAGQTNSIHDKTRIDTKDMENALHGMAGQSRARQTGQTKSRHGRAGQDMQGRAAQALHSREDKEQGADRVTQNQRSRQINACLY